jgi:predicted alpha/beta superfamily hydrolase
MRSGPEKFDGITELRPSSEHLSPQTEALIPQEARMTTMITRDSFQVRATSPLEVTVIPGDPGAIALYVLDAAFLLDVSHGVGSMLGTLAHLTGEPFPRPTFVGIGYPTRDLQQLFALRARDLTPSAGTRNPIDLPPLEFGGAEDFLTALTEELVPSVESRYDVDRLHRGLVGFSFGGLFGLYTLLHRPDEFSHYLVGSPSLWWDNGLPFTWETDWAAAHDDLPVQVFAWVGGEEQSHGGSWKNERFPTSALEQLAQVDRFRAFVDVLHSRHYPTLRLDSVVIDGEYHLTAPPAGLARGLQHLLGGNGH